jgi:hypothetical protein
MGSLRLVCFGISSFECEPKLHKCLQLFSVTFEFILFCVQNI